MTYAGYHWPWKNNRVVWPRVLRVCLVRCRFSEVSPHLFCFSSSDPGFPSSPCWLRHYLKNYSPHQGTFILRSTTISSFNVYSGCYYLYFHSSLHSYPPIFLHLYFPLVYPSILSSYSIIRIPHHSLVLMKEWLAKWQISSLQLCGPGLHICVTLAFKIMMTQSNQVFLKSILFLRRILLHELEGISLWSFDLEAVKVLNHLRIRYSITRYNVISKLISAEYSVVDEFEWLFKKNQDCLRLRLRLSSNEDAIIHVFIEISINNSTLRLIFSQWYISTRKYSCKVYLSEKSIDRCENCEDSNISRQLHPWKSSWM